MSLPSISPELLRAGDNRFLSRFVPSLGISLSEMDYLRGWRDDFLGLAIHEQYTAVSGVGSGGGLASVHGGVYVLAAGAAAGAYHHLWLGNAADGYATLDADLGWVMMANFNVSQTTSIAGDFGARDAASNNIIRAGLNTTVVAANWSIVTRTGGGAINSVDSGIPADINRHWHVLNVYPITGGLRQVDYSLDGTQIATTIVSVPTIVLTPIVTIYAVLAAARAMGLDFLGVIPRNLA
uniref:Uncharacterized protein n=1 Tax=viral metagenome TaxID=1070528 RepID=A0A6M3M4R2_9ZZZZ